MAGQRHKPEEIVAKLRQVDVLISQDRSVSEAIRSISEANLDVFSEFSKDGLDGCFEGQAFSRGEIDGDDDFLDFLVGECVEVDVARQPSAQSAVGVFDAALLP